MLRSLALLMESYENRHARKRDRREQRAGLRMGSGNLTGCGGCTACIDTGDHMECSGLTAHSDPVCYAGHMGSYDPMVVWQPSVGGMCQDGSLSLGDLAGCGDRMGHADPTGRRPLVLSIWMATCPTRASHTSENSRGGASRTRRAGLQTCTLSIPQGPNLMQQVAVPIFCRRRMRVFPGI